MTLDKHWMPFTANKNFKAAPRMIQSAEGMYWTCDQGQSILDMTAGLWCTNLGHSRTQVAEAIFRSAQTLDYAPSFNFGHSDSFVLAERLAHLCPGDLNRAFFTTSGSEAVDTALKIAMSYQVARGKAGKKMIISRELAYHGVNLGGTAVGGIPVNTRNYSRWASVDLLPHTLDIERNAFSRGLPEFGIERAEVLQQLVELHGAENIAAVIVEPISGAGGVIIPPEGYLQRLREICDEHDILLIFDEVVCAFGRVGSFTAAQEFNVTPDMMTMAKGLTSGTVPMGAVMVDDKIYNTIVDASEGIEFFHGYTYSAHPLACAAALACLDIYEKENLFTRAQNGVGKYLEQVLHRLKDLPGIIDIRNYGLLGAVQFEAQDNDIPMGSQVFAKAWENGLMIRGAGDSIIVSPPLILEESHIDEFSEKIWQSIKSI
ncbi:aminotransferase class III-fold pyridoxal phosphate-dependent enzyme [Pseudoteredinibacter isoporae]|uniref:Beta-alanine--pyruvate transaminase n=1 Tax=Pseudoteredinibacter isoporae TaxID=570281 RepID=A0A7X0JUZ8_9GAMM|nr:aminotransferase class III-fold pyridoxal phosphate-dependent enzyme [Pseudoteredinibacter isoporae]MBB6522218.1 beta-alanine--pyruvate transaminase [Pseudoteredinibacter isoporae]NHO87752.1 aminotransferase class III-fold pyridoxal phosphate-dependent enzyme [Pseudoteredinibacter isoporae]NIB23917.1 aminotransferase class III-fold pyridoxal phosphate-dependent enzyme [Pseudoteredinibacter isoporae]